MYCPSCGQQQLSSELRFCSKCGMPLTGVTEVLANGGMLPIIAQPQNFAKITSPRKRGLKQGGIMMLLGVFFVPMLAILVESADGPEALIALTAVFFFVGGFLRMLYAAIFQDGTPTFLPQNQPYNQPTMHIAGQEVFHNQNALPPQQSVPIQNYAAPQPTPQYAAGNWRSTTDLLNKDTSEKATQLLDNETK
jgi:zinc-ribbon domain